MTFNAAYQAHLSEPPQPGDAFGGDICNANIDDLPIPAYLQYILHCMMFVLGRLGQGRQMCDPQETYQSFVYESERYEETLKVQRLYQFNCHLIKRGVLNAQMAQSLPQHTDIVISVDFWHRRDTVPSQVPQYSTDVGSDVPAATLAAQTAKFSSRHAQFKCSGRFAVSLVCSLPSMFFYQFSGLRPLGP